MPALTITAADHTTGQLTIPAHGLSTGDGPGGMYAAGGTPPTGLTPSADYYAIKIDANTIKLADSNAHANAGSAISFSTNGSGALSFLIGLPYRRPRTYVPGLQVKGSDFNAIFDTQIARSGFFETIPIAGTKAYPLGAQNVLANNFGIGFASFTNNTQLGLSIDGVGAGRRIIAARWKIQANAGSTYQIKYYDQQNVNGIVGTTSAGAGAVEVVSVPLINSTLSAMDFPTLTLTRVTGSGVIIATVTAEVDVDWLI